MYKVNKRYVFKNVFALKTILVKKALKKVSFNIFFNFQSLKWSLNGLEIIHTKHLFLKFLLMMAQETPGTIASHLTFKLPGENVCP